MYFEDWTNDIGGWIGYYLFYTWENMFIKLNNQKQRNEKYNIKNVSNILVFYLGRGLMGACF